MYAGCHSHDMHPYALVSRLGLEACTYETLVLAMQMLLRISGSGVTPFSPQKQQQLMNVFVDATAGNLSTSQFTVLLVSSAFSSRHRSLLQAPVVVGCNRSTLTSLWQMPLQIHAGSAADLCSKMFSWLNTRPSISSS